MIEDIKSNLENRLSNEFNNIKLEDYVDEILVDFKNVAVPITFDSLFLNRKIRKINIKENISHNAYIEIIDNGFEITTKKKIDLNNPSDRYLLAHEIAHTFQYEIKSHKVINKLFFLNGSNEQEYFSDFIARAILMPTTFLKDDLAVFKGTFESLKQINLLCKKYLVDYDKLIIRILHDLKLFDNVVILRFIQFKRDMAWKLFEKFASTNIDNKRYFIPQRNYNKEIEFKNRFPSTGNKLNLFLSELALTLSNRQELSFIVQKKTLEDKPLLDFFKNVSVTEINISASMVESKKYLSRTINIMMKI